MKKYFSSSISVKALQSIKNPVNILNSQYIKNSLASTIENFRVFDDKKISIQISNSAGLKTFSEHRNTKLSKDLENLYDNNYISSLFWFYHTNSDLVNNLVNSTHRKEFFEKISGIDGNFNSNHTVYLSFPNNDSVKVTSNSIQINQVVTSKQEKDKEVANPTIIENNTQEKENIYKLSTYLFSSLKEIFISSLHNSYQNLNEMDKIQITQFLNTKISCFTDNKSLEEFLVFYYKYLTQLMSQLNSKQVVFIISDYDKYFISKSSSEETSFFNRFFNSVILNNCYVKKVFFSGKYLLIKDLLISSSNYDSISYEDINVNIQKVNFKQLEEEYKMSLDIQSKQVSSSNYYYEQELLRQNNLLSNLLNSNEKTYLDTVKSLVSLKLNEGFTEGFCKAQEFNSLIKQGLNLEGNFFNSYLLERFFENYLEVDESNNLKFSSPCFKDFFSKFLFPNNNYITSLNYKLQLAYNYFTYLDTGKVVEYFTSVKHLFEIISENAKGEKNFEKFPNFSFRTEKDLDEYLVDILSLDMNTLTSGSKDKISIYEVEDDTVSISENLKKFTLIVYEDKNFAIYIKGNKLKKAESANVNENDESNVSELVKPKSQVSNLQGTQVNATTKSLIKLNETKLNNISKHEALNFALKANKDLKIVYVISLSNYLKQIEYSIMKINVELQNI